MSSVLIRQSVFRGESKVYDDIELDTSEVTIGTDADNIILLRGEGVRARHAVVVTGDGGARIHAVGRQKIVVNGKSVSRAEIAAGDRLAIGQNVILVLPAPPGFALALQVEVSEPGREQDLEASYRTDLRQTRVAIRGPAWVLGLSTLTLFFVVPLVTSQYFRGDNTAMPMAVTDGIWSSGTIHTAHRLATNNDCSQCHSKLFSRVPDSACAACHETVMEHTSPQHIAELGLSEERCGGCHREHNGPEMLVEHSGADCANCHVFESLAAGHPPFTDYPNPLRPQIIFDHASHQLDHFQDTERVFECGSCHALDTAGQHQTIASFESMCVNCHGAADSTVASKVFHHGDQIVSAKPIVVFTLPRVDLKTLAPTQRLGAWPEETKRGSRTGLTRLGITPLTELLLSTDPHAGPALSRLKQNKTKLSSLKSASEADVEDVLTVLWSVKRLLADLAADSDATLTGRLEPVLQQPLGKRKLAALTGQIPTQFLHSVIAGWFPADTGTGLEDDLKNGPIALTDNLLHADPVQPVGVALDLPGASWVRTGQWREQKFAMQYQPSGHADSFVKVWLDVTLHALQNAEQSTDIAFGVRDAAEELFNLLSDSKAKPGRAKGAGRCSKCHSQVIDKLGQRRFAWSATQANPSHVEVTRFSHAPHIGLGGTDGCMNCHILAEKGEVLSTYAIDAEPAAYVSNFAPIEVQACSACHAPQKQASDQCLNCHNYHVSAQPGQEIAHALTTAVDPP